LAGIISPSRIECDPGWCAAQLTVAALLELQAYTGLGLRQFNELIAASLSNHQSLARLFDYAQVDYAQD